MKGWIRGKGDSLLKLVIMVSNGLVEEGGAQVQGQGLPHTRDKQGGEKWSPRIIRSQLVLETVKFPLSWRGLQETGLHGLYRNGFTGWVMLSPK